MTDHLSPRMKQHSSAAKRGANRVDGTVGPYSRALRRGALGTGINGSSREGRYLRDLESQLVGQLGGSPTPAQRLLIGRVAIMALRLDLFDQKIASGGDMTVFDAKIYGALHNSLRLCLSELGLKGTAPPKKRRTLADIVDDESAA